MGLRKSIKRLIKNWLGDDVLDVIPRGGNPFYDIRKSLPEYTIESVFDVGANIGQSVKEYKKNSPASVVYCFEPVSNTYSQLQKNIADYKSVQCFQIALSDKEGVCEILAQGKSSKNFLLREHIADAELVLANGKKVDRNTVKTEQVSTTTLDGFCQNNGVSHLCYLKIDTEGADFSVLMGAESMLAQHKIDFVEVEAGMNPGNQYHISIEQFKAHMEEKKYYIFGIYEQTREWPKKQLHLRRANLLFISQTLINKNSSAPSLP